MLITSGPTREPIDPVRFISNYSTGYMGALLAAEALARGHRTTVVTGPGRERLPDAVRVVPVEDARGMERALRRLAPEADVVIMAAAVSDFRPLRVAARKLHRPFDAGSGQTRAAPSLRTVLELEAVPDLIARLPRQANQLVVGFAVETERVVPRALRKLRAKRLDLLVAQQASRTGSPFGRRPVRAWLLAREGNVSRPRRFSKPRLARVLLDKIEALWYGQPTALRTQHEAAT